MSNKITADLALAYADAMAELARLRAENDRLRKALEYVRDEGFTEETEYFINAALEPAQPKEGGDEV
jgi:hypothetical protein